jgi:peptidoglycan/LPS O-acetylase OafA/YrhL
MGERKTISEAMQGGRGNAFNLIRLAAAWLVFFSHEHLVTGKSLLQLPGYFGVEVFFIISGFLIARSWDLRGSNVQYFENRALRILPALWTVVLVSTFVVGPLVTTLPLSAYFSDPSTWRYLLNLVFEHQRVLPGVFRGGLFPVVNAPLWSLAHEALFYLVLAALGLLLGQRLRQVLVVLLLIALAQDVMLPAGHGLGGMSSSLVGYFLGGAVAWHFRGFIPLNRRLLLLALAAIGVQLAWPFCDAVCTLSLPYVVLWLGLHRPPAALRHFIRNDYSYGLYVWGMICQQCVLVAGITGFWPHAVVAAVVAALCAYGSWHLVEKRFLGFKNRAPRAAAPRRQAAVVVVLADPRRA